MAVKGRRLLHFQLSHKYLDFAFVKIARLRATGIEAAQDDFEASVVNDTDTPFCPVVVVRRFGQYKLALWVINENFDGAISSFCSAASNTHPY